MNYSEIEDVLVDKIIVRASITEKWVTIFFTDGSNLQIESNAYKEDTFHCVEYCEEYPSGISSEMIVNFVESSNTGV